MGRSVPLGAFARTSAMRFLKSAISAAARFSTPNSLPRLVRSAYRASRGGMMPREVFVRLLRQDSVRMYEGMPSFPRASGVKSASSRKP